jgi:hypothetical protein
MDIFLPDPQKVWGNGDNFLSYQKLIRVMQSSSLKWIFNLCWKNGAKIELEYCSYFAYWPWAKASSLGTSFTFAQLNWNAKILRSNENLDDQLFTFLFLHATPKAVGILWKYFSFHPPRSKFHHTIIFCNLSTTIFFAVLSLCW